MKRLVIFVLCTMLLPPLASSAQPAETRLVSTPSGRLSLAIPADWVIREFREEGEIEGLDSETLLISNSYVAIDLFLDNMRFDGTVIVIGAYPYHVFEDESIGRPVSMLADVMPFDEDRIAPIRYGDFDGAEYYFEDTDFFAVEALFDSGELGYRVTSYSTRFDDYDLLNQIIGSSQVNTITDLYVLDQDFERITTRNGRISMEIPSRWLYWDEGDTSYAFASDGAAYADISYSFRPHNSPGVAVAVQRIVYSGLREGEMVAGRPDLAAVADRLRDENGGLAKDSELTIGEQDGTAYLDAAWLIPNATGSTQTRTRLYDGGDSVYIIQIQHAPDAAISAMVARLLAGMAYHAPDELADPTQFGLAVGFKAPEFELPLLEGGSAALSDYAGQVVFLNLWASWCTPCHREAPAMQTMYQAYDGAFEILAINVGETVFEASSFQRQYGLTFPILMDEDMGFANFYRLVAYPTTYIIGRDGVILEKIEGSFSEEGLADLLALYQGRLPQ